MTSEATISEIIQREKDPFEQARIEQSYYGILNIMYYLKAKYTRIHLRYSGYVYIAHCEAIEGNSVIFSAHGFQASQDRKGLIHFEAFNRYYTTTVQIEKSNERGIFIQFPQDLKYLQRRQHIRLRFDDLFMRFIILYSPIGSSRMDEKNLEGRFPYIMQEIAREDISLQTMYRMMTAEFKNISPDFDVKIFNKTSELTLAEKLLKETGKSFYIEDTMRINSYTLPLSSSLVINYNEPFEKMVAIEGETAALKFIETIRKADAREFIVSYLMSPLKLFGEVIGYTRLETNQFDKKWINSMQADDNARMSELVSYAMSKVRIRRSHYDPSSTETRVVNISLSGLLMEISDATIFHYLKHHRRVKILLPILGEDLELFGEIVRYTEHNGFYYMGVLFFKARPGDTLKLENFIHENMQYQFM